MLKFSVAVGPCRLGVLCLITAILSACGGGGGSGDGGSTTPTPAPAPVPVPTPSPSPSMIPAAPATGAVLYTDAAVLRPLVPGAVWIYRGSVSGGANSVPRIYANVIEQASAAQGGVAETASNLFNGGAGDSARVYLASGSIKSVQNVKFTANQPTSQELIDTELNSPVLQNHQYTVLEQRGINSGVDADGDGKIDLVDVAAYRTVIGNETVTLPNIGAVAALRVDMTNLLRVTYSSTGAYSAVVKVVQSYWYAPGIGLVRQRLVSPVISGADEVDDELLVSWDGVSKGVGAMAPRALTVPADNVQFGGKKMRNIIETLAFSEHGVVRMWTPGDLIQLQSEWHFALIDKRGQATKVVSYLNVPSAQSFTMMPAGTGFAEIAYPSDDGIGQIHLFDNQAKLISPAAGIRFDLGLSNYLGGRLQWFAVAGDGDGFWVLMQRGFASFSGGTTGHIVLRKYDFNGQPVGTEAILANTTTNDGSRIADLSVSSGQVIASWVAGNASNYAVRASAQAAAVIRRLDGFSTLQYIKPLALQEPGKFALLVNSSVMPYPINGVLLDGDLNPLLAAGNTSIVNETLSPAWGTRDSQQIFVANASAGRIVMSSYIRDKLYPESDTAQLYVMADYPLSASAWSKQAPNLVKFTSTINANPGSSLKQLVFADRVVVLASDQYGAQSVVAWRR